MRLCRGSDCAVQQDPAGPERSVPPERGGEEAVGWGLPTASRVERAAPKTPAGQIGCYSCKWLAPKWQELATSRASDDLAWLEWTRLFAAELDAVAGPGPAAGASISAPASVWLCFLAGFWAFSLARLGAVGIELRQLKMRRFHSGIVRLGRHFPTLALSLSEIMVIQ